MRHRKQLALVFAAFLVFEAGVFAEQSNSQSVSRRFAVAMGSNHGGKDRVRLRYAVEDAKSVLDVLQQLGGVAKEDSLLLLDPDVKTFRAEMEKLNQRIKGSRQGHGRVEVFFYYSGHSDERCILLGSEKVSYEDVRDSINKMDADVRIAILDSCSSGAFTRLKGGKARAPFLFDTAFDMKGFAVMTSSSSTEASQESDLIKSSFFTHYLISGLRGAADTTLDGRVTLSEAYQFAFNETLTETTKTAGGPQHPYYDIQMSGTGDVVMTDVRKGSAVLVLSEELSGRVFIHDPKNRLVVELTKPGGRTIELGLEEGRYRIISMSEKGGVFESHIALAEGRDVRLEPGGFIKTEVQYTTPRGDRALKIRRGTLIGGAGPPRVFGEFGFFGHNNRFDAVVLQLQGSVGVTFNHAFSVGLGGGGTFNKIRSAPYQYGCLYLAYDFYPRKKVHFRLTTRLGSGYFDLEDNRWYFFFSPGAEVVVNISPLVRLGAGFRKSFVDIPGGDTFHMGMNIRIGR